MKTLSPPRIDYLGAILDLLACLAGFGTAIGAYAAWIYPPDPDGAPDVLTSWLLKGMVLGVMAWVAVVFADDRADHGLQLWLDHFFWMLGLNLIVQYGLTYVFYLPPLPWLLLVAGSLLSVALVLSLRSALHRSREGKDRGMLVGLDAVGDTLALALQPSLRAAGVMAPDGGHGRRLAEVVEQKRPGTILIGDEGCRSSIPASKLLELGYAGVAVESGPALYEKVLHRVCLERLRPADFLFASAAHRNRVALAFHAVYTNLIGLGLLLVVAPVIAIVTVLLIATGGGNPVFESVECLGFQLIPFSMLRFRTRRRDGSLSEIGKALTSLRLVNLPQLINVVRGEMALIGPPPMRQPFADKLCQLLPTFIFRFTVKPGIMGWSQTSLGGRVRPVDEAERLEYDLYYVKQESLSFDIEILLRTLFRGAPGAAIPQSRAEVSSS